MERLVANISGRVRRATMHGRPHLVVPVTMIVPGVLNGSQGPLLYEHEDIKAWNGMPVVVYHPQKDGQQVSARDPDVLEKQQVGMVLQSRANGKLRASAWLDEARLKQVDPRVLNDLNKGKPVEVSTGLFVEREPKEGSFNGRRYTAVARNYRPDHLAILPDQVGACSVADGCGLLVNKQEMQRAIEDYMAMDRRRFLTNPHDLQLVANMVRNATKQEGSENLPASAYAYVPDPQKPSTWKLRIDDAAHVGGAIAAIGKGFRGQRVSIPAADMPAVKRKIRSAWLKYHPDKKQSDLPPILRNTRGGQIMAELTSDDRTQMIEDLIGNCEGCWNEDQRDILEGFSDDQLSAQHQLLENAMAAKEKKKSLEDMSDEELENELKNRRKGAEPAKNEFTPPANAEDWFKNAPESVQETFKIAANIEKREKEGIVEKLVANLSGPERSIHKERLMNRSLEDLQSDLALLPQQVEKPEPQPTANEAPAEWAREAAALAKTQRPVKDDEPLGLPTMDTGKKPQPALASVANVDPAELQQLPPNLQEMVRNAVAIEKRQKAEMIQQIIANVQGNDRYRLEDKLSAKSLDELRDMLLLRGATEPARKPSYRGAAAPLSNVSSSTLEDENDVLPLPTMVFEKRA